MIAPCLTILLFVACCCMTPFHRGVGALLPSGSAAVTFPLCHTYKLSLSYLSILERLDT